MSDITYCLPLSPAKPSILLADVLDMLERAKERVGVEPVQYTRTKIGASIVLIQSALAQGVDGAAQVSGPREVFAEPDHYTGRRAAEALTAEAFTINALPAPKAA